MISGDAPDVFVNHVTRLPEFIVNGVITDMASNIAADNYDMAGYYPGLAETWRKDGATYGLPKDWDTVAIAYDKDKLAAAGLSTKDVADLNWNPQDGGSFAKVIAKLTVDNAGVRGDEANFNGDDVAVYGFVTNNFSAHGQTEWSFLAASTGWHFIDAPWSATYHYDDPRLMDTLTWLRDLARNKHHMPTVEQSGRLGAETLMFSDKGAMTVVGSWLIGLYADSKPSVAFAPIPAGPKGRQSMFNGLADSIWVGSKHQDAAWQWVKYLGSDACQSLVAKAGVVFPARSDQVDTAVAAYAAKGIDVTAFTDVATPETTFAFPITDYGNEVSSIAKSALDEVMLGRGEIKAIMQKANQRINDLF